MLLALTSWGEASAKDLSFPVASNWMAKGTSLGYSGPLIFGSNCEWVQDSYLQWDTNPDNTIIDYYQPVSPEMFELLCPAINAMLDCLDRHGFLCCQEED